MRHRNAGFKLGRNTSHRRALLRNLVTSVLVEDRVETTLAKAKAVRPLVEKMITLGKKGDLHSRRQAHSFLMTDQSVERLFETVAPRYGDRQGGYLRIVRTGFQKGDGAEKAFIELLGAEKQLDAKRQKRTDLKAKKRAELEKRFFATAFSLLQNVTRASAAADARACFRIACVRFLFHPCQPFGPECAHEDVDQDLEGDGAGAIEEDIPRRAGAVGEEGLVPFIATGDQRGSQKPEEGVGKEVGVEQGHPPGAQPCEANRSVPEEVAGLADVVVDDLPAGIANVAEDGLVDAAQRAAGVVGAEKLRRLQHDDGDTYSDRQPGVYPVTQAALPITRHDSWAPPG
jgi:large subunit ribosomal protein L17